MTASVRRLRASWIALVAVVGLLSSGGRAEAAGAPTDDRVAQMRRDGCCCVIPMTGSCCCEPVAATLALPPSTARPTASASASDRVVAKPFSVRTCQCRTSAPTAPSPKPDRREPEGRRETHRVLTIASPPMRADARRNLAPAPESAHWPHAANRPIYLSLAHLLT